VPIHKGLRLAILKQGSYCANSQRVNYCDKLDDRYYDEIGDMFGNDFGNK